MGLDMYLYMRGGVNVDENEEIKDIEIGYWRKFNALHKLFLDVCGADPESNTEEIDLTKNQLIQVYDICTSVKDILDAAEKHQIVDHYFFNKEIQDKVQSIMPTQGGFFWGDIEIDSDYHTQLIKTIPILENALKLMDEGERIYYYSWW